MRLLKNWCLLCFIEYYIVGGLENAFGFRKFIEQQHL